ncbi:MAG: lipid-binding SYLF domain-containing protein [Sulfurovum sp.]|nr:lipid-binding SYLF domain-containing protein [Sulfurovum sp.]NNJ45559.1 lipid-binding SYLF domain-containing protein [Sulfurovum sp.]
MKLLKTIPLLLAMLLAFSTLTLAEDTAEEIDNDSNEALMVFYKEVNGGKKFLDNAKGYVVFPDVKEAGFFVGGKYGEGALRVNGETSGYYSITSASMGFQMGAQQYSLIIAFTTDQALKIFMRDDDWETELDLNIALAEYNAEEEADDVDFGSNMVGFVFDSEGMMGNFSFEGTRFERITPDID